MLVPTPSKAQYDHPEVDEKQPLAMASKHFLLCKMHPTQFIGQTPSYHNACCKLL